MKIHISRQGIVIRTVEVRGDKASVGSGADCDIRIDDPYLSAHVADLVNRGGEWRIVDAATSIEGLTHNGRRVEDEPMVPGERYGLGAFELVAEGAGSPAAAPPPPPQTPQSSRPSAPVTMMESLDANEPDDMPAIPRTMFEAPMPGGIPGVTPPPPPPPPPPQAAPSGFQPIATPQPQRPAAPPAAPPGQAKKRSKLPLLLAVIGLMFVLLLIVGVMMMGGGEEQVATETAPAPTPEVTDTAPKTAPEEQGNQFASRLEIDSALDQWEAAIQAGGNEPLRARYAQVALDAAMVHAAANDAAKSRGYLERVVKFGPPDSPEVEKAKARLGS